MTIEIVVIRSTWYNIRTGKDYEIVKVSNFADDDYIHFRNQNSSTICVLEFKDFLSVYAPVEHASKHTPSLFKIETDQERKLMYSLFDAQIRMLNDSETMLSRHTEGEKRCGEIDYLLHLVGRLKKRFREQIRM